MAKEYIIKEQENAKILEPDYSANYTVKDYLDWTFDGLFELIKGRVFKMSAAPSAEHAKIDINILRYFLPAFPKGNTSCHVFTAPFDVFLLKEGDLVEKGTTVVQPDICVVCKAEKIQEKGCVGAPDLVVEILSTSTAKKDFNEKYNAYEEFGVKEYWIVFPGEKAINIYSLIDGKFELHQTFKNNDLLQSPLFENLQFVVSEVF